MSTYSFKYRLLLYVYSTRNIIACLFALCGPCLLFIGWIQDYWLAITFALYIAGYLIIPAPRLIDAHTAGNISTEAMLVHLDAIIAQAEKHLTQAMRRHLLNIRAAIQEILPRIQSNASHDFFLIKETILRYLPETLANYTALPPVFRASHVLKEGKTAQKLLEQQLSLLDTQMQQILVNVAQGDAQALLANGEFLNAKFKEQDFLRAM